MKFHFYLLILSIFVSCSKSEEQNGQVPQQDSVVYQTSIKAKTEEYNWKGFINKTIPVFIHYSVQPGGLIVGEIVYLNTQPKTPILLVGDNRVDSTFHLAEYSSKGEVSGVMKVKLTGGRLEGTWSNLKDRGLALTLSPHDTTYSIPAIQSPNLEGTYSYRNGLESSQGELTFKKVNDTVGVFSLQAKGKAAKPIPVKIEEETVFVGSYGFLYEVPEGNGCALEVTFFKDFVEVHYAQDSCQEFYSDQVSPAGVYVKVK